MNLTSVLISRLGGPEAFTYPDEECGAVDAYSDPPGSMQAMSIPVDEIPLRKADWEVVRLTKEEYPAARALIKGNHYSCSASAAQVMFHGLKRCLLRSASSGACLRTGELVGVAHWLPAARPCAIRLEPDNWRDVLSLSRLAVKPGAPFNAATFLLGRAIRDIRQNNPRWRTLVTFADTRMDHTGGIYRGTNWDYDGLTRPYDVWVDDKGCQVGRPRMGGTGGTRLGTRSATVKEMRDMGYTFLGRFPKHRFTMRL